MLATFLYGCAVIGFLMYVVLYFVPGHGRNAEGPVDLLIVLTFLAYATVGTLILLRQPRNLVGWLVGAVGFFPLLNALPDVVLRYAPNWQVAEVALWYGNWYFVAAMGTLPVLFLLFPDGHPASRRWRWPVRLALIGLAAAVARQMLGPGDCAGACTPSEDNPFQPDVLRPVIAALGLVGAGGLLVGLLSGAASLFWRFHRARGVERQQVKWLAAAVVIGLGVNLVQAGIDVVWPRVDWLLNGLFATAVVLPAVAIAVAVLRFRLYDLGQVVSRTVSYAVITALLVGVYLVLVTASTRLLPDSSSFTVAASTLAAAALFQPLRRRVQTVVDRRFNRARYDADRTIEAFTRRLREDVALDAVRSDLVAAVQDTLEPARVGLWLREVSR
jgi:hypothetical protein